MGGYAGYVWPSYLLTFVVMAGLWLVSQKALKKQEKTLQKLEEENDQKTTPT